MNNEKKGMTLFYNYLDNEFKELSYEQVGKLVVGLLYSDSGRGVPSDVQEDIHSDLITRILFSVMKDKTERATQKWYEINERFKKSRKKDTVSVTADDCNDEDDDYDDDEDDDRDFETTYIQIQNDVREIYYVKGNETNIPQVDDIENLLSGGTTDDVIHKIVDIGNKDYWKESFWDIESRV